MTEWFEKSATGTFLINKVKLLLKFKSHTHNDKHQIWTVSQCMHLCDVSISKMPNLQNAKCFNPYLHAPSNIRKGKMLLQTE